MPIPVLQPSGILPPGEHLATLAEVRASFGTSSARRADLFGKLNAFVADVTALNAFDYVLVDGSFVTDKPAPGDIDAVLKLKTTTPAVIAAICSPAGALVIDQHTVKAKYEVHLFIDPPGPSAWSSFFQLMRPAEAISRGLDPATQRGILKVML